MPSHLSSLGFRLELDVADQQRLVEAAITGEQLRVRDGTYVRWSPGDGVELWLQIVDRQLVGFAPHFRGEARMRVALTDRISRPEESLLDGAFHGWADPADGTTESGRFPFVFDAPDPGRFTAVQLPSVAEVQIAAFAHELIAYDSDEAFYAAQEQEVKLAADAFVQTGLLPTPEPEPGPPEAVAHFAGLVLAAARLRNGYSGGEFLHARVRILGGEVDVVADPDAVDGDLRKGALVRGTYWLSGRLSNDLADRARPFWRRVIEQ